MSRKSKRRRTNPSQPGAGHDGFDFLDDRDQRAGNVLAAPVTVLPPTDSVRPASPTGAALAPVVPSIANTPRPKPNTSPSPRSIRESTHGRLGTVRDSAAAPVVAVAVATAPVVAPAVVVQSAAAPVATLCPPGGLTPPVSAPQTVADPVTAAAPEAAATSPDADADADGTSPVADADADATGPTADSLPPGPTVGEILIAAREARGLTLEAASTRTRMSSKTLRHLENDRFGEFAADAYMRGSLRSYGSFLRLDLTALLQRYDETTAATISVLQVPVAESALAADRSTVRAVRPGRASWIAALAAVVLVVGGVAAWLLQRSQIELRPRAGLEQIETDLRASTPPAPATASIASPATPPAVARSEDTAAPAPPAAEPTVQLASAPPALTREPGVMTDLVEIRAPASLSGSSLPAAVGSAAPAAVAGPSAALQASASPADAASGAADAVVLTATATGPCVVRLTTDGESRRGIPYEFSRSGESRSWTARRGFRIVTRSGQNLQLTLNGRAIATPADGRVVTLDRRTLEPSGAQPVAHRRRPRPRPRAAEPAPGATVVPGIESRGGMIPPR